MTVTKLTFNSNHAKKMFVEENAIGQNEIMDEGNAWMVLREETNNPVDWSRNGWVYAVKVLS